MPTERLRAAEVTKAIRLYWFVLLLYNQAASGVCRLPAWVLGLEAGQDHPGYLQYDKYAKYALAVCARARDLRFVIIAHLTAHSERVLATP
eukprot:6541495-Prymnesium_polylepis.1